MTESEKIVLPDEALAQVSGGEQLSQTPEYLYKAKVLRNTQLLSGVPNTQVPVQTLAELGTLNYVRVISEEVFYDYMQRPYLHCYFRADTPAGYVLQADIERCED